MRMSGRCCSNLDEGKLADAEGRNMVDFRNTVVVMTCNLGAWMRSWAGGGTLGFRGTPENMERTLHRELRSCFSDEFLGRLDAVIPFLSAGCGKQKGNHGEAAGGVLP